jgi:VIT1/CCC1 family predicted Fe2+/Mn2+ transporter
MPETTTLHNAEPHAVAASGKLNWLRAGVLGANDGIVSVAGIVIGVAAATAQRGPILTGALLPLIAVLIPPAANRIPVTMIAVSLALVLTGYISATIGNANRITALVRVTLGGLAAMAATYAIGTLVGHALT